MSPGAWNVPSVHANHWELFAFCVLLDLFALVFANQFIVVDSDSMSACKCVRDLSAALDSPELAVLTRQFLSLTVRLNVRVLPRHIPGVANVLADPLSRDEWSKFGCVASEWCSEHGFGRSAYLNSL